MIDIEPIKAFIQREFVYDQGNIGSDDVLFPDIIDSLGVMELVEFVEDVYGIEVGPADLLVTNFSSLAALASLIQLKMAEEPRRAECARPDARVNSRPDI